MNHVVIIGRQIGDREDGLYFHLGDFNEKKLEKVDAFIDELCALPDRNLRRRGTQLSSLSA